MKRQSAQKVLSLIMSCKHPMVFQVVSTTKILLVTTTSTQVVDQVSKKLFVLVVGWKDTNPMTKFVSRIVTGIVDFVRAILIMKVTVGRRRNSLV